MKSDGAQLALFSMNHRVGAAFTTMGERQDGSQIAANVPHEISAAALARAAAAGDFQLAPAATPAGTPARVTSKQLPLTPGAYVLADGGGERFGGNTFLARNANTNGQFLFIITEGGPAGESAHIFMRGTSRTSSRSMVKHSGGRTARPCPFALATTSRRRRATCMASA